MKPLRRKRFNNSAEKMVYYWHKGGTLHNASIAQWLKAEYEDRVATSAAFFFIMRREHPQAVRFQFKTTEDLMPLAVMVESCITATCRPQEGKPNPAQDIEGTNIPRLAYGAFIQLGLIETGQSKQQNTPLL